VLPRRQIALLDGALLRVAALALQKQFHAFATAKAADGTDVTCHADFVLRTLGSMMRGAPM
jgi:hypothetical protein